MGRYIKIYERSLDDPMVLDLEKRTVVKIHHRDFAMPCDTIFERITSECCGDIGISSWHIHFTEETDVAFAILRVSNLEQ